MASVRKNPLLLLFIFSFVTFNILFFSHTFLIDTAFEQFNVYAQCAENTTNFDSFGNCDYSKFTVADDIINGVYALSIFGTLISGSTLLAGKIERLWQKSHSKNRRRSL